MPFPKQGFERLKGLLSQIRHVDFSPEEQERVTTPHHLKQQEDQAAVLSKEISENLTALMQEIETLTRRKLEHLETRSQRVFEALKRETDRANEIATEMKGVVSDNIAIVKSSLEGVQQKIKTTTLEQLQRMQNKIKTLEEAVRKSSSQDVAKPSASTEKDGETALATVQQMISDDMSKLREEISSKIQNQIRRLDQYFDECAQLSGKIEKINAALDNAIENIQLQALEEAMQQKEEGDSDLEKDIIEKIKQFCVLNRKLHSLDLGAEADADARKQAIIKEFERLNIAVMQIEVEMALAKLNEECQSCIQVIEENLTQAERAEDEGRLQDLHSLKTQLSRHYKTLAKEIPATLGHIQAIYKKYGVERQPTYELLKGIQQQLEREADSILTVEIHQSSHRIGLGIFLAIVTLLIVFSPVGPGLLGASLFVGLSHLTLGASIGVGIGLACGGFALAWIDHLYMLSLWFLGMLMKATAWIPTLTAKGVSSITKMWDALRIHLTQPHHWITKAFVGFLLFLTAIPLLIFNVVRYSLDLFFLGVVMLGEHFFRREAAPHVIEISRQFLPVRKVEPVSKEVAKSDQPLGFFEDIERTLDQMAEEAVTVGPNVQMPIKTM